MVVIGKVGLLGNDVGCWFFYFMVNGFFKYIYMYLKYGSVFILFDRLLDIY